MSFKVTLLTLVDQQNTEDCVEGRGAIKKPRSQAQSKIKRFTKNKDV